MTLSTLRVALLLALGPAFVHACSPGYSPDYLGGPCTACTVAKYKPLTGTHACTSCPQYSVTSGTAQTSLSACTCQGGYTGPDGGPCSACGPSTYKPNRGPQSCTICPSNSGHSSIGQGSSTSCICNAGYTGPNGGLCTACAAGKIKPAIGSAPCIDCEPGKYSSSTTVCTDTTTPAQTTTTTPAPTTTNPAPTTTTTPAPTTTNPAPTTTTTPAPTTTNPAPTTTNPAPTTPTPAATSEPLPPPPPPTAECELDAWKCPSATQLWEVESEQRNCHCCMGHARLSVRLPDTEALYGRTCLQCLSGKYSDTDFTRGSSYLYTGEVSELGAGLSYNPASARGDPLCSSCPANSDSPPGSSALSSCKCNIGFTGIDGGTCSVCPAGKYKDSIGDSVCTDCGVGTYSAAGATACTGCGSGYYYSSSSGASPCKLCATGQYSWGRPQVPTAPITCTPCKAGEYKDIEGPNNNVVFSHANGKTSLTRDLNYNVIDAPESSFSLAVPPSWDFDGEWSGLQAVSLPLTWDVEDPGFCSDLGEKLSRGLEGSLQGRVALVLRSPPENFNCNLNSQITHARILGAAAIIFYNHGQSVGVHRVFNNFLVSTVPVASISYAHGDFLAQRVVQSGVNVTVPWAACSVCPANSFSPEGSSALSNCTCNSGYTGSNGGPCTACATGSYKPTVGSVACTPCEVNTYSTTVTAAGCAACPTGKFNNVTGSSACFDLPTPTCQAGQIWNASIFACVACGVGTYQPVGPF
jgi:hypothetical protein